MKKNDDEIKLAAIELAIHLKGMALSIPAENAYLKLCLAISKTHDKNFVNFVKEKS